jgi:hypothetical protein
MTAPKQAITGLGYDENMGGLDLSGCPSLRPLSSSDSNWLDPRFAPLDQSGQGQGNALKEFLTERLAEHESPSVIHVSNEPFTIRFRDKVWHGEGTLDGQRHRLAANSRDQLIGKLMQLAKPRAAFRSLTPEEELEVIRLCQSGDKLSGIGVFLKHAIGEARTNQYNSPIQMMADPKLIPVMDACCNFCWFHSHPHAIDTPDWHVILSDLECFAVSSARMYARARKSPHGAMLHTCDLGDVTRGKRADNTTKVPSVGHSAAYMRAAESVRKTQKRNRS